jgi:uncharacterized metal-binding protein YceD (DUF177 family)
MSINLKININSISYQERIINVQATEEELLDVANFCEILACKTIKFQGGVQKKGSVFIVQGVLTIDFIQECSVTLEEIASNVMIDVAREYKVAPTSKLNKSNEIIVNIEDNDIEYIDGNTINIKEMIQEILFLEIDPFIKKISNE